MNPSEAERLDQKVRSCFIMRGLPGSGKSTWWRKNHTYARVFCNDDKHMEGGKYVFKQHLQAEFHRQTFREFVDAIVNQSVPRAIVVDNTNLRVSEIGKYYEVANAFDYRVTIIQLTVPIPVCIERNVHGLTPSMIYAMANAFKPLPNWWKIIHV